MTGLALAVQSRTFRSLRRHRNYRLFFTGQLVSLAGSWMQSIALAWLVIELSHSPLAIGILAFCRFLPFTVLGLFTGVVVDRFDTRRLVMATQASAMGVSAVLAVVTLTGTASLPIVLVLAALGGVAFAFDAPARQALTFQLVGPRELPNAVALNSGMFNASRIVGPAIAGVVIAATGTGVCFALNGLSFLAVIAALASMKVDELHPVTTSSTSFVRGTVEAFRFAVHDRQLRIVLFVVALISTVGFNFNVLVPLLASSTVHVGARGFGLLSAAFGLGALAGALLTASSHGASWRQMAFGAGGFGAVALLLAPVHSAALAGALLVAIGVCFTLFTANANALVQLGAPDHLRGRLIGLYLFAFIGLAPLGGLLAGWLADLGGTALAFGVSGATAILTLLAAAVARSRSRSVGSELAVPDSGAL
jgi:MFS family permease